jgi:prepilin-type N-terminal cleavage/methylation domain-containing protein/prepilin-type processing-associated H-X9-DG protein
MPILKLSAHRRLVRSGFTLIELLTVIAIIGILAAILIPTVGSVRNKAKSLKCTQQLRNWGQAVRVFANDNKGDIALTMNVGTPTNNEGPGKLYSSYLGSARYSGDSVGVGLSMDSMDFFSTCPTLDRIVDTSTGAVDTRRSYSFIKPVGAKRVTGGIKFGRTNITVDYYNLSNASGPSRLILMVEAKHPATSGNLDCTSLSAFGTAINTYVKPIMIKTDPAIDVRHNGIVNVLFLDGSVRQMRVNNLDVNSMPPATRAQAAPMYTL